MKEAAVLLLLALLLNGCSANQTQAQQAYGGAWEAVMSGGIGTSSGFTFLTEFSVGSNGALSITNVTLENTGTCFGSSGIVDPGGTLSLTYNSAFQIVPPSSLTFTFKSSAGDTITLTSTSVTGTLSSVTSNSTLTNGLIVGAWALAPASGSSCVTASGNFTMTQGSTT